MVEASSLQDDAIALSQGTSVNGHLILDGVVEGNECVDQRYMSKKLGLIHKLDLENDRLDSDFFIIYSLGIWEDLE